MRRRDFLGAAGGAAAWPLAARARQAIPVIGVLGIFPLDASTAAMTGLRKGLAESDFNEGRNVAIETRWTPGMQQERLMAFASELVHHPVSVLVATGSAGVAHIAKKASDTIPIVFANGSDPIKVGLVTSMNRPDANITGVSFFTSTLGPKRLELLRELLPTASKIAFLVNPTNPVTDGDTKDMEDAARSIGQSIVLLRARNESEIDAAFEAATRERVSAILVNVDAFFNSRRHQLARLAAQYRIPASYNTSQYVTAGGLMSYGDDRLDSYRHVGLYVGRILRGDKPTSLPVLQPTKFNLVINLKAAKVMGLTVPPTLLARADEVIE